MPRDLFGDVTRPSISVGNRKWYTVPVSLLSHAAIVLLLIAIPILAPAAMPAVFADNEMMLITHALPIPPPPPARQRTEDLKRVDRTDLAPVAPPDGITKEIPRDDAPGVNVPG